MTRRSGGVPLVATTVVVANVLVVVGIVSGDLVVLGAGWVLALLTVLVVLVVLVGWSGR